MFFYCVAYEDDACAVSANISIAVSIGVVIGIAIHII